MITPNYDNIPSACLTRRYHIHTKLVFFCHKLKPELHQFSCQTFPLHYQSFLMQIWSNCESSALYKLHWSIIIWTRRDWFDQLTPIPMYCNTPICMEMMTMGIVSGSGLLFVHPDNQYNHLIICLNVYLHHQNNKIN